MKPKLSICIPTYNRAALLEICLKSIVNQLHSKNDLKDIEVVISDNASSDGTRAVVGVFQKKYKNIRYFRNKTNIGGDRNIIKAASHATGDYIWFFSDDDIQYHNACNVILSKIHTYKPDSLLSNLNLMSSDGKTILEKNKFRLNKNRLIKNKKELFTFLETTFFLPIEWYTTCMSCLVVHKKVFKKNISSVMKNYDPTGNAFLHTGLIYYNSIDYVIYIIAKPLFGYRADNTRMLDVDRNNDKVGFYTMIRDVFGAHLRLISKINRNNVSMKFRLLIELKYFSRTVRILLLRYLRVDIINVLISLLEKK